MSRSYNQKLTVEKEIETTPFTPETLAGDLAQLQSILIDFFDGVSSADWDRPTERQGTGWTLRQTLAHVTAVAEVFQKALEDTLAGIPHVYPGLTSRADLPAVLERDIAAREHIPPDTLIQTLLETLAQTTDHTTPLTSDQLALPVDIRAYNRPLTVAELIGVQIVHLGVVHAAQLANAVEAKPLWIHYSAGLMQRQMTRFFHLLSHSYWPQRGGNLRAGVNYIAAGAGGGRWYVTMDPDGGSGGEGRVQHPTLTVWTPSANALCRIFTFQVSLLRAMLTGQMLGWGDVRLGFRMPHLFVPT